MVSLCQGGFGLLTGEGEDEAVLAGIARALKPGGRLASSAFNAYFSVKYQTDAEFDADRGIAHESTELRSEIGEVRPAELWTSCYTPRELRLLLARQRAGHRTDLVGRARPRMATCRRRSRLPEFLVIARRVAAIVKE